MTGKEPITPCPWALWTVWSTEVADLMKRNITREEFATSVVDIVRDKDSLFDTYVFSSRPKTSEIFVIQPVKVKVREGELEIVGILYKPGAQSTSGKRWTLIAENELADVFKADETFISSNGVKNLLIILGGNVEESSQQIQLNKNSPSKIIRFIDNSSNKPDLEGERIQSFKNPYDEANTNVEIVHIFKLCLQSRPNTSLLKSFPRLPRPCISIRHSPRHKTPNTTPKSQRIDTSLESNKSSLHITQNGISSSPSDIEITSPPKTSEVVPLVPRRSPLVNSTRKNSALPGGFIQESEDESPNLLHNGHAQQSNNFIPKRRRIDFDKHDKNTYFKLKSLEDKLVRENETKQTQFSTLRNINTWMVVDEVIKIPTDEEFAGVLSKMAASYILRVSDETKSNILVRLCTLSKRGSIVHQGHKVGPRMKPTDIIRLHRATAQFENVPPGDREMVISSAPHLNYSIINYDSNINGPIHPQRLAVGELDLRDEILKKRIKELREFILNRLNET